MSGSQIHIKPCDKYSLIYGLFFLIGLVYRLPWSFFSNANTYWMYKFRDPQLNSTNSTLRTPLQAQFNAMLSLNFQMSGIISLLVFMRFANAMQLKNRLYWIVFSIMTMFLLCTAFTQINTDSWQTLFFATIMIVVVVINALKSLYSLTIYTMLSVFPPQYMACFLSGSSFSGIVSSILQILSVVTGMSIVDTAFVYFALGTSIVSVTWGALLYGKKNKFFAYYMDQGEFAKKTRPISVPQIKLIMRQTWFVQVVSALYVLTYEPLPTALVVSEFEGQNIWGDVYFVPVVTYFLAGIWTLLGTVLACKIKINLRSVYWTIFGFLRFLLFLPSIMLCNAQPRKNLPVIFPHDYQYIVLTMVERITGSFLLAWCSDIIKTLVPIDELENAYHLYMTCFGIETAVFSLLDGVVVYML